jgi:arylformamidase
MPTFYDITQPIEKSMAMHKARADLSPALQYTKSIEKGDHVTESRIALYMHTGTHADAPKHGLKQGRDISAMPLETYYGPCQVVDCTHVVDTIGVEDLKKAKLVKGARILLKTRQQSKKGYDPKFVSLNNEAAELIVSKGIQLLGIDTWSMERDGYNVHQALFKGGVAVLEGLSLKDVPAGEYTLIAFPLKISGADASPVRAVLMKG